ncbi:secreted protein containing RagB/SusD domain protein [gut metagenome]|uniref:Secreted protein containing RagB/SusD domain protein n=1 Tax=gut metagenome TaxID=749906 RepID=J9GIV6_9ZZZZ
MKRFTLYTILGAVLITGMTSCDSFLDTMPDQRTELGNVEKVRDILLSAYPNRHPELMFEFMSDNYEDNGVNYKSPESDEINSYFWQDLTGISYDSPQSMWDAYYSAIAAANQALEAIDGLGTPEASLPYKGEALLCRAYGHFMLANIFCMAYQPATASQLLGIPYTKKPEKAVGEIYDRGTLEEVYQQIDADIEEALPLIKKTQFTIPVYHFNSKAAYAFAARFNLFYGKDYDKVIRYATEAIGDNPTSVLRDLKGYNRFTTTTEWTHGYISAEEPANLMLLTTISRYYRSHNKRYSITQSIFNTHLAWSPLPGNAKPEVYNTVFHLDYMSYFIPKMTEIFEITDQMSQTGLPHIVVPLFTTDETLLCRAEAYILKKAYEQAATDLSYWYSKKGAKACTVDEIVSHYSPRVVDGEQIENPNATPLNTGVTYEEKQLRMLQAVLHVRRIETLHEGMRWLDIKRYGIECQHTVANQEPLILKADDLRKAIQIPSQVLAAPGNMAPNPR